MARGIGKGFFKYSKARVSAAWEATSKKMAEHPKSFDEDIQKVLKEYADYNKEIGVTPPPREVPSTRLSYYKTDFLLNQKENLEIQKVKTRDLAQQISVTSGLDFNTVQESLINSRVSKTILDERARKAILDKLRDNPKANINFEGKEFSNNFAKGITRDLNALNKYLNSARKELSNNLYNDLVLLLDDNKELTGAILNSEFSLENTLKIYGATRGVEYADSIQFVVENYKRVTEPYKPITATKIRENPGEVITQIDKLRSNLEFSGKQPEAKEFLSNFLEEIKQVSEGLKEEQRVRNEILSVLRNSNDFKDLMKSLQSGFNNIDSVLAAEDLLQIQDAFASRNLEAIENVLENNLEKFPNSKLKLTSFGKEIRDVLAKEFFQDIPEETLAPYLEVQDGQIFIKSTPESYKQANTAFIQFLKDQHSRDFNGLKDMVDRMASYDDVQKTYIARFGSELMESGLNKDYWSALADDIPRQRLIYDGIHSKGERIHSSLNAEDRAAIALGQGLEESFLGWAREIGININELDNFTYRFYSNQKLLDLWRNLEPSTMEPSTMEPQRQLTNQEKVDLSRRVFVEQQMDRIDWERTAPDLEFPRDKREWLRRAYDSLALDKELENQELFASTLFGGAGLKHTPSSSLHPLLKQRKIFYKDGKVAFDAMLDYGINENLFDNLYTALKSNSAMAATTDIMGYLPSETKRFFDNYFKIVQPENFEDRTKAFFFYSPKHLSNIMGVLSEPIGYVRDPGLVAKAYMGFRSFAIPSMLGNVVKYALLQDPVISFYTASKQGKDIGNYITRFYANYKNLSKRDKLRFGAQSIYMRHLAPQYQAGFENQFMKLGNRFSDFVFTVTGTNWLTKANKASVGFELMADFAELRHLSWEQLPIKRRSWWAAHEVNESLWEAFRKQKPHTFNDVELMNPLNYIEKGENIVINQEMQSKVHFMIRQAVPEGTNSLGALYGQNNRKQVETFWDVMRDGILTLKTTPIQIVFDLLRAERFLDHGMGFVLFAFANGLMIQAYEDWSQGKDFNNRWQAAIKDRNKMAELGLQVLIKGYGNMATDVMGALALAPFDGGAAARWQAKTFFIPPTFDSLNRTATSNIKMLNEILHLKNPNLVKSWRKAFPLQKWMGTDYVINQLLLDNLQQVLDSDASNASYFDVQNRRAAKEGAPFFKKRGS